MTKDEAIDIIESLYPVCGGDHKSRDCPEHKCCQADRDGECIWKYCPQVRDGEQPFCRFCSKGVNSEDEATTDEYCVVCNDCADAMNQRYGQ